MAKLFRQGDVLLVSVETIPATATIAEREDGKIILARGEVTGHHHAVLDRDVDLLATANAAERWLRVGNPDGAVLTHQEHAPITLPPGAYQVVIQREYEPREAPRNAAD